MSDIFHQVEVLPADFKKRLKKASELSLQLAQVLADLGNDASHYSDANDKASQFNPKKHGGKK